MKATIWLLLSAILSGCSRLPPPDAIYSKYHTEKIQFSLDTISPEGLRGPPDGLRSVAYEFFVPADDIVYEELRRIDPSIQLHKRSRGRIGYSEQKTLCIGETYQEGWKEKLLALSALPYTQEIRECYFE